MPHSPQTPTGPDPESGPRVVFLPFSASDFDAGWSLDWSPELEAQPQEPPSGAVAGGARSAANGSFRAVSRAAPIWSLVALGLLWVAAAPASAQTPPPPLELSGPQLVATGVGFHGERARARRPEAGSCSR